MKIVGIDCGLHGALALYDTDEPDRVIVEDMPVVASQVDAASVARVLRRWEPGVIVVEALQPMPKNGSISSFKLGTSYGVVLGVVASLQVPAHYPRPQAWKKHYRLTSDKERSRKLAIDRFPADASLFARVKDGDRAEAALIALYGAETIIRRDAA